MFFSPVQYKSSQCNVMVMFSKSTPSVSDFRSAFLVAGSNILEVLSSKLPVMPHVEPNEIY